MKEDNKPNKFREKLQQQRSDTSSNPEQWYSFMEAVLPSNNPVKVMENVMHCTINSEVFEKIKGMDKWSPDVLEALDKASSGCRGFHELNQKAPQEIKDFLKGKAAEVAAKKSFGIGE